MSVILILHKFFKYKTFLFFSQFCNTALPRVTFYPLDFGGHTRSFDHSEAACRNRCHEIEDCTFYVWDASDTSCRVADKHARKVDTSSHIPSHIDAEEDMVDEYSELLGGECTRIDLDKKETSSCGSDIMAGTRFVPGEFMGHTQSNEYAWEGCRNRCHVTRGCRGWAFRKSDGGCQLSPGGSKSEKDAEWEAGECEKDQDEITANEDLEHDEMDDDL